MRVITMIDIGGSSDFGAPPFDNRLWPLAVLTAADVRHPLYHEERTLEPGCLHS